MPLAEPDSARRSFVPFEPRVSGLGGRLATIPWHPVVFAAAYVLTLWVETGVSVFAILRALLLATGAAAGLVIVLALLIRRRDVAGFVALIIGVALVSRGIRDIAAVAILATAIPAALIVWSRIRRRPLSAQGATRSLNGFAAVLLAVVLIGGLPRGAFGALVEDVRQQGSPTIAREPSRSPGDPPDILILLLDGYPRADSLQRLFGADNDDFIDALGDRGFDVAPDSRSNYPYTQATLTSMLHMQPLDTLPALDRVEAGATDDYPHLRLVLNRNPVFDIAREKGYSVVVTSPGYEHVTLRHADVFLDDGSLNEFERHLIRATPLQYLIDAISPTGLTDQHRHRTISGFEFYDQVAAAGAGPLLALIHVPSPHVPIVIGPRGEVLAEPPPVDDYREEPIGDHAVQAYLDQLSYLNARTLASLDRALEAYSTRGSSPVLVVMSDHGAAAPALPGEAWGREHYANFFAVRWPDAAAGPLFGSDASPVNLFPVLFNELFQTQLPTWPDQPFEWRSDEVHAEVVP